MKLCQISLRDPFIYPDAATDTYYLYGSRADRKTQTAFDVYSSRDLSEWRCEGAVFSAEDGFWGKRHFWAPELHRIGGKYYLFATFMGDEGYNRCQLLVSDRPNGDFRPYGSPFTPTGWASLDGTFYTRDGQNFCVFCHEWKDVGNGEICLLPLDADLQPRGEATVLFRAKDAPWVVNASDFCACYVTDGPFLIRWGRTIFMLWSSFSENGYALSYATARDIRGPWKQTGKPLLDSDCGHGMIFRDFEGKYRLVCHSPNTGSEHPVLYDIRITEEAIEIV